jgi:hypothetical protein
MPRTEIIRAWRNDRSVVEILNEKSDRLEVSSQRKSRKIVCGDSQGEAAGVKDKEALLIGYHLESKQHFSPTEPTTSSKCHLCYRINPLL